MDTPTRYRQVAVPVARNVVKRDRLFRILDSARSTPVVLVCAPAGAGKSLLVASWWTDRALPHGGWVNLWAARGSASQVWHSILEALMLATPEAQEELRALQALALRAPQDLPASLGRLLNEQAHDTYLVIDDLHAVTEMAVHDQLVELVAASVGRLHVVAITRHDPPWPLHRMRLDGLLVNLRTSTLSFDVAEAAELFASLDVALSPERVSQLVTRTEGWAAGLRLAAMGASTAQDPDDYLDAVSGRDEYIADYLLREVYEGLSVARRDLLAQISVVDEVTADLAEALGGGPDSAEQLAELARQNAFISQLGDRPGWYRLHPLLADFLRSRATGDVQRRSLHRRAAQWFEEQGEPWLAMSHALAAQDWAHASDLVGTHVATWTVRRPPTELKQLLSQVPREETLTRPGLAIGLAAAMSMLGESTDLLELVAAARSHLGPVVGVRRERYELLVELISVGTERWAGDLEAVREGFQRLPTEPSVLGALGLADWFAVRTLLISNLGTAELWTGQLRSARLHLIDAARADAAQNVSLPTLNAQAHLAYLYWIRGELELAESTGRAAVDSFVRMGMATAVQSRTAYLALAGVAIDQDDLAAAPRWLEAAAASAGERHTQFAVDLMSARLVAADGRLVEAVGAVRDVRERYEDAPFPLDLVTQSDQLEAQILDLARNRSGLRSAAAPPIEQGGSNGETVRERVSRHLSGAKFALVDDRRAAALDELESALVVAAPHRLRQPFLAVAPEVTALLSTRTELGTEDPDFLADLLARRARQLPRHGRDSIAVLVPLTARETNILPYLATTLTIKEIAQALYVSSNTVKTHQRSIYQKLGARDRRQAVAHARQLALL
ncbi:MAG: LuxR C-terminal-related transcriptional regulator [Propionibacteriaceae bacterium]